MKTDLINYARFGYLRYISTGILLLMTGCGSGDVYYESSNRVPMTTVREEYNIDELNRYGEWVYLADYGNVWRPFVDLSWKPFYYGHWTYTDEGWAWISYEPFGWIVYHYGNWIYTPEFGWVWIPSYGKWSPARVQWMQYGDYVCWAPLPFKSVLWPRPWEQSNFDVWMVVRTNEFTSENVGQHRVDRTIVQSEPYRGEIILRRPEPRMIQERSGTEIRPVKINREKVVIGKREFGKMRIPNAENIRIEKYRPKVEKEVIKHPQERKEEHRETREEKR